MDHMSRSARSLHMARIRREGTKPELAVRSCLHRLGYRFRLHANALPGTPDIILARFKVVIFVHGCFWHRHRNCPYSYVPKSRVEFWTTKFDQNVRRDRRVARQLRAAGWRVVTVWECQARSGERLRARLTAMMDKHQGSVQRAS